MCHLLCGRGGCGGKPVLGLAIVAGSLISYAGFDTDMVVWVCLPPNVGLLASVAPTTTNLTLGSLAVVELGLLANRGGDAYPVALERLAPDIALGTPALAERIYLSL